MRKKNQSKQFGCAVAPIAPKMSTIEKINNSSENEESNNDVSKIKIKTEIKEDLEKKDNDKENHESSDNVENQEQSPATEKNTQKKSWKMRVKIKEEEQNDEEKLPTSANDSEKNHTSSSKLLENPFSKIPIKQLLEETEEFQNNDEEFMNLQIKPAKLWEIPENNGPSMQCHVCFEYFWSAGRLAYHIIAVHEKNDTKRNNETVSEIPKIENNSRNHSMEPETNIKQEFDTEIYRNKHISSCNGRNKPKFEKIKKMSIEKVQKTPVSMIRKSYIKERRTSQEPNEDHLEYSLPYGWKKIAIRRQGHQFRWDFYIIAPCGMRLRSNPEVDRYLENNPKVKCDREVTNTSRQWPGSGPENLKRVTKAQSPDRNYLVKDVEEVTILLNNKKQSKKECHECGSNYWSQTLLDEHISSVHGRRRSLRNKRNNNPQYAESQEIHEVDRDVKKPRIETYAQSVQELRNLKNVEMSCRRLKKEPDFEIEEDISIFEPEISIDEHISPVHGQRRSSRNNATLYNENQDIQKLDDLDDNEKKPRLERYAQSDQELTNPKNDEMTIIGIKEVPNCKEDISIFEPDISIEEHISPVHGQRRSLRYKNPQHSENQDIHKLDHDGKKASLETNANSDQELKNIKNDEVPITRFKEGTNSKELEDISIFEPDTSIDEHVSSVQGRRRSSRNKNPQYAENQEIHELDHDGKNPELETYANSDQELKNFKNDKMAIIGAKEVAKKEEKEDISIFEPEVSIEENI